MITKADLDAVLDEIAEEKRRELGDPPPAAQMEAYARGQLPPDQEERVRESLAWNSDLARTQTEPFPAVGASPGEPGFVSGADLERRWTSLQKRIRREHDLEPRSVVRLWQWSAALAAGLAVVFGGLLWRAESDARRLRGELMEPRIIAEQHELGGAMRGGPPAVSVGEDRGDVVFVASLFNHPGYEKYRVEIAGGQPQRTLWSETAPLNGYRFSIVVPRQFLQRGTYEVAVYGIEGTTERKLETYPLEIDAPPDAAAP